jgi:hypothetical protein
MKTFKQYFFESREDQINQIRRALNGLCYQKGLDPAAVSTADANKLSTEIQAMGLVPVGWSMGRFVAAVKQMAGSMSDPQGE